MPSNFISFFFFHHFNSRRCEECRACRQRRKMFRNHTRGCPQADLAGGPPPTLPIQAEMRGSGRGEPGYSWNSEENSGVEGATRNSSSLNQCPLNPLPGDRTLPCGIVRSAEPSGIQGPLGKQVSRHCHHPRCRHGLACPSGPL